MTRLKKPKAKDIFKLLEIMRHRRHTVIISKVNFIYTSVHLVFYYQFIFCNRAVREIGFEGLIGLAFDECGFHSIKPPFDDRFLELSIRDSMICHSRRIRYVAVVARLNLHRLFTLTPKITTSEVRLIRSRTATIPEFYRITFFIKQEG